MDLKVLVESWISCQKKSPRWRPVRQQATVLAPLKDRLIKRSLRELVDACANPESAAEQQQHSTELEAFNQLTTGLGGCGSGQFPIGQAPSFEAVLCAFFRSATSWEIADMVQYAEPLVAWRKREFERKRWVEHARARWGPMVQHAFASDKSFALGVRKRSKELSIDAFAEAAALQRLGVDADLMAIANVRNLKTMAGISRVAVASEDPRLSDLVHAAGDEGLLELDDLLEHVSWEPSLRAEFESIAKIGCAKRDNLKNGYWKGTPVGGMPPALAPSRRPPRMQPLGSRHRGLHVK